MKSLLVILICSLLFANGNARDWRRKNVKTNEEVEHEVQEDSYQQLDYLNCPTTRDINPVCGSNDITYINLSAFQCAARRYPSLNIVKYGACRPEDDPRRPVVLPPQINLI